MEPEKIGLAKTSQQPHLYPLHNLDPKSCAGFLMSTQFRLKKLRSISHQILHSFYIWGGGFPTKDPPSSITHHLRHHAYHLGYAISSLRPAIKGVWHDH